MQRIASHGENGEKSSDSLLWLSTGLFLVLDKRITTVAICCHRLFVVEQGESDGSTAGMVVQLRSLAIPVEMGSRRHVAQRLNRQLIQCIGTNTVLSFTRKISILLPSSSLLLLLLLLLVNN